MPRRAWLADAPEGKTLAVNGEGEALRGFIGRVESEQAAIDEIMANAKEACEPHRQGIAALKKEAAEAGFSKKEFSTVLRKRRLEVKLEHVADQLDENQVETYAQMLHALGGLAELPLGQAAAAKFAAPQ